MFVVVEVCGFVLCYGGCFCRGSVLGVYCCSGEEKT